MYIFMLKIIYFTNVLYVPLCIFLTVGGAMHFIYYINRLTATKVDSTYLVCLTSNAQQYCLVAGLERMTTGSVVKRLTLSRHTSRQNDIKPNTS